MRPAHSPFLSILHPTIWVCSMNILFNSVSAVQINGTIDDNQPNDGLTEAKIDYFGTWQPGWACHPAECVLQPDPSNMVDATWHYSRLNINDSVTTGFNLTFLGEFSLKQDLVLADKFNDRNGGIYIRRVFQRNTITSKPFRLCESLVQS
jgi:hypothetical protein